MVKKKINKKELSPSERHFGVVLEDIDSKLDLLVEGHESLVKGQESLVEGHESLVKGQESLDRKIDKVDEKLENFRSDVDYRFKVLTEMTAKNMEDVEIIKSDIGIIKNSLKKKVDLEEFESLEKRVLLLEKKIIRGKV